MSGHIAGSDATSTTTRRLSRASRLAAALAVFGFFAAACGGGSSLTSDAGEDFSVTVGTAPEFNGCDSSGEITNYQWVITGAPETSADSEGKTLRSEMNDCNFTLESAMEVADLGTWTIELTVTDGSDTATDVVQVEVVDS